VNLKNGNIVASIPLFSLPQLGKLSLSFSLSLNSQVIGWSIYCSPIGPNCNGHYGVPYMVGPTLVLDQDVSVNSSLTTFSTVNTGQGELAYQAYIFSLKDSSGAAHVFGSDSNNWNLFHANDGSGYTFVPTASQPYNPILAIPTISCNGNQTYIGMGFGKVTTADGVIYALTPACPQTVTLGGISPQFSTTLGSSVAVSDPNGNSLSYSNWGSILDHGYGAITDTVGRVVQSLETTPFSSDVSACPNLGIPNEPALLSKTWNVPAPNAATITNGATVPYVFCYAEISYNTDFVYPFVDGMPSPDTSGSAWAIQSVVLPNKTYWGFAYSTTGPNNSVSYADLEQIQFPTGGSLSYTYSNALGCNFENQALSRYVASRQLNDSAGNVANWQYVYSNNYNGSTGVDTLTTKVTDPLSNDTVHVFTGTNTEDPCDISETSTVTYQGPVSANQVLSTTNTVPAQVDNPQSVGLVRTLNYAPASVTTTRGGVQSTTSYAYPALFTNVQPQCWITDIEGDSTCNVLSSANDFFNRPATTTTTNFGGGTLKSASTVYNYTSNPSYLQSNWLSQPASTTVTGSGGNTALTNYGYDARGNLTSTSKWLNTNSSFITTSMSYNSQGMLASSTDANQKTTTITYDGSGLFPSVVQHPSTINGAAHVDYYSYYDNLGSIGWHTDENGSGPNDPNHTTSYSYDVMGRILSVNYPDGGGSTFCYTDEGIPNSLCSASSPPFRMITSTLAAPDPVQSSQTGYDGLGRQVLSISPSGASTETEYDPLGRVASVSNPHFPTPSSTDGYTTYSYDALGRILYKCNPDNGTGSGPCVSGTSYQQWSYNGNVTNFWDENRNAWQRTSDAAGRLTKVLEPNGSSKSPSMETDYTYDALNNLLSVTQWGGPNGSSGARSRSFTYDSLSRLMSATNPETGTVSYTYDGNGNVLTKTDGRNVITTFAYDELNRVLSKTYTNDSNGTPAFCFQYDTPISSSGFSADASPTGNLTMEWTQKGVCPSPASPLSSLPSASVSGRIFLNHDSMRRVLVEQQCVWPSCGGSTPSMLTYVYDLAGNLNTYTNGITSTPASGLGPITFTQSFNAGGQLQGVGSSLNDPQHPASLFSALPGTSGPCTASFAYPYTPAGGLANATFGNVLTLSRGYDNRLRTNCEIDTGTVVPNATNGSATVTITGSEQSK
jgi:YD repeat-containing protein